MKRLKLSKGLFAKVDDADFEWLNQWKWTAHFRGGRQGHGAYRNEKKNGKIIHIDLHRFITKCPKGMIVDHINHDALDNRRKNLRVCTQSENCMNQRRRSNSTTGVKGVWWHEGAQKYTAAIMLNGKSTYLGVFKKKKDAAVAYAKAADKLFGKYAFID